MATGPALVSVSHDLLRRPTRIKLPDGEVQLLAYDGSTHAVAMTGSASSANAGGLAGVGCPQTPP